MDRNCNIIVSDCGNHRIRKITPQGHVSTVAGTGEEGHQDGEGTIAHFNQPYGVAVDENGNVIVADWQNHCIRRVVSAGAVTPLFLNRNVPPLLQSSFASDMQHHLSDSGSFHDVCFVVERERVPAHQAHLSARCEYFRSMFSAGFKEGDTAEIRIEGTSSAAFKALLKYLYTDIMEVDDAVLFDLVKLSDQYHVGRLHNLCLQQLFKRITVQNAVMRLLQAHTASGAEELMWAKLKSMTMRYVTCNLNEIRCIAMATLDILYREHPALYGSSVDCIRGGGPGRGHRGF